MLHPNTWITPDLTHENIFGGYGSVGGWRDFSLTLALVKSGFGDKKTWRRQYSKRYLKCNKERFGSWKNCSKLITWRRILTCGRCECWRSYFAIAWHPVTRFKAAILHLDFVFKKPACCNHFDWSTSKRNDKSLDILSIKFSKSSTRQKIFENSFKLRF